MTAAVTRTLPCERGPSPLSSSSPLSSTNWRSAAAAVRSSSIAHAIARRAPCVYILARSVHVHRCWWDVTGSALGSDGLGSTGAPEKSAGSACSAAGLTEPPALGNKGAYTEIMTRRASDRVYRVPPTVGWKKCWR